MDPISSPELDSEATPSGAPGQVVGPGGSVLPSQATAPQPQLPPSPPPSTGPTVTVAPSAGVIPAAGPAPTVDLPRPIAVGDSPPPASSVILPPQTATFGAMPMAGTVGSPKTPFIKKFAGKKLILMAGVPLVLLGSSAAAYFGYVVPNKPQNVLAKALSNTLLQHQFTTAGTVEFTTAGLSSKLDYSVKADADNHATDSNLDVTVSGVKVPVELMSAKGNAYFKVGNVSGLSGVLGGLFGDSSQVQTLQDQINSQIANQWIEVDSTLIKEAKLSCLTDYPAALGPSDLQVLRDSYSKTAFAAVSATSSEDVNGHSAYKYELQLDDNKLSGFKLGDSTYFKKLKQCLSDAGFSIGDVSSLKDNDKTPITLWVDKKTKMIVKYYSKSTPQDKTKDDVVGSLTGTINYGKVTITPPANTKALLDVLGSLDLSSLGLSDAFSDPSTSSATNGADAERKTDINAMHGQIEAYQATNIDYPSLADLNDGQWRSANMPDLDSEALKDPAGSASHLVSAPTAHAYSYAVLPAGCDNVTVECQSYTLTATLEDGTTYAKQSLNDDSTSSILN